jgi:hypothetical protein
MTKVKWTSPEGVGIEELKRRNYPKETKGFIRHLVNKVINFFK